MSDLWMILGLHDLGPPQHAFLDFCWPVLLHQEGKSMYQAAGRTLTMDIK